MRRALVLLLLAPSLFAQRQSTHCQTADVNIQGGIIWRLIGCGEGFADNVAWNVDKSDGKLDGWVVRRTTGRGALVFVMDTSIRPDHDELMRATGSVVVDGLSYATPYCASANPPLRPCTTPNIVDSHGTAVASVIAGRNNGIAPDARLVAVFVVGRLPSVKQWTDALDGMVKYAWDHAPEVKTAVVNVSAYVTDEQSHIADDAQAAPVDQRMRDMIFGVDRDGHRDPNGKRFFFVAAAGNVSFGNTALCASFPTRIAASTDGLVNVEAVNRDDTLWSGSCHGPQVELAAPGADLLLATADTTDHYAGTSPDWRSFTSFAAPYVTGLVARMLEAEPDLRPAEIEARLKASPVRAADGLPIPVILEPPSTPRRRASGH